MKHRNSLRVSLRKRCLSLRYWTLEPGPCCSVIRARLRFGFEAATVAVARRETRMQLNRQAPYRIVVPSETALSNRNGARTLSCQATLVSLAWQRRTVASSAAKVSAFSFCNRRMRSATSKPGRHGIKLPNEAQAIRPGRQYHLEYRDTRSICCCN